MLHFPFFMQNTLIQRDLQMKRKSRRVRCGPAESAQFRKNGSFWATVLGFRSTLESIMSKSAAGR
jgi:hypothetical protein